MEGPIVHRGNTAKKCLYFYDNATKYCSQYILFYSSQSGWKLLWWKPYSVTVVMGCD